MWLTQTQSCIQKVIRNCRQEQKKKEQSGYTSMGLWVRNTVKKYTQTVCQSTRRAHGTPPPSPAAHFIPIRCRLCGGGSEFLAADVAMLDVPKKKKNMRQFVSAVNQSCFLQIWGWLLEKDPLPSPPDLSWRCRNITHSTMALIDQPNPRVWWVQEKEVPDSEHVKRWGIIDGFITAAKTEKKICASELVFYICVGLSKMDSGRICACVCSWIISLRRYGEKQL